MGCSASRSANFVNHNQNPTPNSSSSFSNSQLQSPYYHSSPEPSSTPVSRTLSLPTPLVHHPPLRKGDSNHFVSLTSTTYGSLAVIESPQPQDSPNPTAQVKRVQDSANPTAQMKRAQDFVGSEDPLSPDSVINTWELMEGLDDDDEDVGFGFNHKSGGDVQMDAIEAMGFGEFVGYDVSKPLWKHLSEESLLAKMDYNVVTSYRKALLGRQQGQPRERLKDLLSPHAKNESCNVDCDNRRRLKDLLKPQMNESCGVNYDNDESCCLLGMEDRIVVYYTSLRGIRKTYEDCCTVRAIFRGFRVCVDERDVSMDRSYRAELEGALSGKTVRLPQVFIRGKYIGGVEEMGQLNESGELAKLLGGFPLMEMGCMCESCGDARFIPCLNCSGSRKVYEEGELRRCPDCNENGLIRCSGCCPRV